MEVHFDDWPDMLGRIPKLMTAYLLEESNDASTYDISTSKLFSCLKYKFHRNVPGKPIK